MQGPRRFALRVTLETASGERIIRPIVLSAVRESDAKYRATIVAPKPGQRVVAVEAVR